MAYEADIVVVLAAGNAGLLDRDISTTLPHLHAVENLLVRENVIIVGGAQQNGYLWPVTTSESPGFDGTDFVYAIAEQVVCASNTVATNSITMDGTSLAAPAVVSQFRQTYQSPFPHYNIKLTHTTN